MFLILIPDLLLRSTLAVSYCLPLRTFSTPLLSHSNTFSGLESATKFNNKSQASPKKLPPQHSVLHSSGLWSLNQRCSCRTAVRASAFFIGLPQLTSLTPPPAGFDSAALQRIWRDRGPLLWLYQLESGSGEQKCSRSSWVTSVSGGRRMKNLPKSPVHPLMTRYDQGRHGDVKRYRGDKHQHTFLHSSFSFFTNFYLPNVIKIVFQFRLLFR